MCVCVCVFYERRMGFGGKYEGREREIESEIESEGKSEV